MDYIPPINGNAADVKRPYINGNRVLGEQGSVLDATFFNVVQAEILTVLESAGLTPSQGDTGQLHEAVLRLIAQNLPNLGDAQAEVENVIRAVGLAPSSADTGQLYQAILELVRGNQVTTPAGVVSAFAGRSPPEGWLVCDGQSLLRQAYPDLYAVIGTQYGSAGTTHFSVPDLRGEFIRGFDDGRGVDFGRPFGTAQRDEFQDHKIGVEGFDHADVLGSAHSAYARLHSDVVNATFLHDGQHLLEGKKEATFLPSGDNGTPRVGPETRPRNVALHYIIKT